MSNDRASGSAPRNSWRRQRPYDRAGLALRILQSASCETRSPRCSARRIWPST